MLIKKPGDSSLSAEVTPKDAFLNRRRFLIGGGAVGAAVAAGAYWFGRPGGHRGVGGSAPATVVNPKLAGIRKSQYLVDEPLNTYKEAKTYNNFYEFGTGKDDPAANAKSLQTRPWSVRIEGEVAKDQDLDIETLLKLAPLEERVYRFRCVEAWSLVVPWVGYSLSELCKLVQPTSRAKFVQFVTLKDDKQMPGLSESVLDWPYVEGLRIDEAMHPLTLLCLGMYGEVLPNQNGAPVRVIVPWKYGFKSAKSLVKIRFTETQPPTSWNLSNPAEYGFYSNVNPEVDHPRWTQASERRIGELRRRRTLPFNGYADQVAKLYAGMDLRKFF